MCWVLLAVSVACAVTRGIAVAQQRDATDQPYPDLPARTHRLSASELKDLPDIERFQAEPSRQFLIDWPWLRTGHPYFGRSTAQPHSGAHVSFNYPDRDLDPGKPESYPAIYAVAEGIITRIDDALRLPPVFFPERGCSTSNVRYGIDLALAKEGGGELVVFVYSIEPMIDPGDPHFYQPFIKVAPGQHVRQGQVIVHMFLLKDPKAARATHIHFNLIGRGGQFQAPTIFHPDLARRFQTAWGPQRAPGDQLLPASFGYGLDEKEDPYSPRARAVFTAPPLDLDGIREIIPLGNLNPVGGHAFPTDHVYLDYGHQAGLAVRAPAAGMVTRVRDQLRGDLKIEIQLDQNLSYYLAHLELERGIGVGRNLSAGQKLGRTSGKSMLNLGASDARIRLAGFVNPDRYPAPTLHAVSLLKLFAESLRSQLYGKVKRNSAERQD